MTIAENKVVTIEYTLKNDAGEVLDTSEGREPLVYLHGAQNIIPGLENALAGKVVGDALEVRITPEQAYGERDDSMKQEVPRDMFGDEDIQVGMQYHAQGPEGDMLVVTVISATETHVTVDGNHPLAGEHLNFSVEVKDVRDASEEEVEHGHVHGAGGHHH
ncbi:MAG: peptidylprolyl isomerase [Gammaproteobacteria bacterium]